MNQLSEVSSKDLYEFKRTLRELSEKKGRGTELVSVYIPHDKQISDVAKQIQEKNLVDKSPTGISGEEPANTPNHASPPSCDGKLPADLSAAIKSLTTDDLSFIQDIFRKVIHEELKPLMEILNPDNGDISDTFPYTPASPDDNGKSVIQEKYKCDLNQIKDVIEKQNSELSQAIAGVFPKHKQN